MPYRANSGRKPIVLYAFDGFGEFQYEGTKHFLAEVLDTTVKRINDSRYQQTSVHKHICFYTAEEIKELGIKGLYQDLRNRDLRWYCKDQKKVFYNKMDCTNPIRANQVKELYNGEF